MMTLLSHFLFLKEMRKGDFLWCRALPFRIFPLGSLVIYRLSHLWKTQYEYFKVKNRKELRGEAMSLNLSLRIKNYLPMKHWGSLPLFSKKHIILIRRIWGSVRNAEWDLLCPHVFLLIFLNRISKLLILRFTNRIQNHFRNLGKDSVILSRGRRFFHFSWILMKGFSEIRKWALRSGTRKSHYCQSKHFSKFEDPLPEFITPLPILL